MIATRWISKTEKGFERDDAHDVRDISVADHTPVHIFKLANYDHYLSDEHYRAVQVLDSKLTSIVRSVV